MEAIGWEGGNITQRLVGIILHVHREWPISDNDNKGFLEMEDAFS